MPEQNENSMAADRWWDGQEYRALCRARMKRERQALEEAEREDKENGKDNSIYL